MDIKPIKSDRDYRRVLTEIDRLMEAQPDTPPKAIGLMY